MKPSIVPSFWTATSMSWNQRSLPCAFAVCWSVRHSVHWIGRFSLRASRQQAVSYVCVVILLPKPPPMSWVTKRSLSSGTRSAGPIQIAATPGIWWLQWIVNWPVPRSYSTSAAEHSSGVEEKRSKCSSLILTTRSAAFSAPSTSPQSNDARPDDVRAGVVVEDRGVLVLRAARVDEHVERLVLDLDQVGGVAGELAGRGDDGDDRLADVAHAADGERVVLDLVPRRRRQLEERIGQLRDLVRRQRPVDALERLRGRDVDRDDLRVRVRRADEVDVAHPVPLDVVGEDALALDEPAVLLARDALAGVADLELDLWARSTVVSLIAR